MERFCFILELKPGMELEYDRRHQEVWPELINILKEAGIRNYTLFRRGGQVIGYAECESDVGKAFSKVKETEIDAQWSEWFKDVIGRQFDEEGEPLSVPEVWHLD